MQQEETVVHIYVAYGGTRLAVGRHVRKFIVLSESLTLTGGSYAACDIKLFAYDIFPYPVYGMDVSSIARQCCYIGHARVHVGGPYGMSHRLILFRYGFVSLAVFIPSGGMSTLVEEEFCLVQVFAVTGYQKKLRQCHFGNLMSRHSD